MLSGPLSTRPQDAHAVNVPSVVVGARRYVLKCDLDSFLAAMNPPPETEQPSGTSRRAAANAQADALGL
jgi:hypothetical protein